MLAGASAPVRFSLEDVNMGKIKRISPAPGGGKTKMAGPGTGAKRVGVPSGSFATKPKPMNIGMTQGPTMGAKPKQGMR